ncbi:MAG: DUF4445 domain-containing protein [Cryobacterium sp.]|nr:DUF4445 domain-containing protein [Oligoflexia bacterium]
MRIKVETQSDALELNVPSGGRLLDYLSEANVAINAACGGNGTCHKCRVRVKEGFSAVSPADRKAFRADELALGWRLSCQARPKTNVELEIPVIENFRTKPRIALHKAVQTFTVYPASDFRVVCDLGSTGVAVALIHRGTTDPIIEAHLLNRQVRYGADVMTRLASAQKLGLEPLRQAMVETLTSCLKSIAQAAKENGLGDIYEVARSAGIFTSGNSAMTTFLLGWPIEQLAVSPFQPHSLDAGLTSLPDHTEIRTLPLLAGFVGGDTVAGILAIEKRFSPPARSWMLVDIGTNTEIALYRSDAGGGENEEELWFSSAPAGPAFEGGNISQGMRAETGAISRANYSADSGWSLATIGGDIPRGICGSGLIDILHTAVKGGLITSDGYLPGGRLELTPTVGLLADDIREFQLAKSATRSAIDLLIERAGTTPDRIYLAGTFAQNLVLESVLGVGLLPTGIPVETIGNGSLMGTAEYAWMTDEERATMLARLERIRKPIELALQDDFQDHFVKNLNF